MSDKDQRSLGCQHDIDQLSLAQVDHTNLFTPAYLRTIVEFSEEVFAEVMDIEDVAFPIGPVRVIAITVNANILESWFRWKPFLRPVMGWVL